MQSIEEAAVTSRPSAFTAFYSYPLGALGFSLPGARRKSAREPPTPGRVASHRSLRLSRRTVPPQGTRRARRENQAAMRKPRGLRFGVLVHPRVGISPSIAAVGSPRRGLSQTVVDFRVEISGFRGVRRFVRSRGHRRLGEARSAALPGFRSGSFLSCWGRGWATTGRRGRSR
jgi:hypothetical protein